jgi:APA family basic amino acid/polyamine antiporter
MLGFGNTIGSGVFTLTGVASKFAGSAVFLGFIISGMVALMTALVFAEFSAIIPKSGSSYVYTYSTFGELPAWIVGWNQNFRYGGTAATQSRAWSAYMVQLLLGMGLVLPVWFDELRVFGINCSPLAVLFLLFCTWITTLGSEAVGSFNNFVTSGKLIILAFIATVSFANFNIENFTPFLDEERGIPGVIEASTILFFGYLGFDFITTISEEAKNPKQDVPRAILWSVILSMFIYVIISFAVNGVGNLAQVGSKDGETALAEIFSNIGLDWMAAVIFVCALLGITAAAMTNLMSQSRILYSYAKDGLFFKVFKDLDPVRNVPIKGSWL